VKFVTISRDDEFVIGVTVEGNEQQTHAFNPARNSC
jgi:hypothetical protein